MSQSLLGVFILVALRPTNRIHIEVIRRDIRVSELTDHYSYAVSSILVERSKRDFFCYARLIRENSIYLRMNDTENDYGHPVVV